MVHMDSGRGKRSKRGGHRDISDIRWGHSGQRKCSGVCVIANVDEAQGTIHKTVAKLVL